MKKLDEITDKRITKELDKIFDAFINDSNKRNSIFASGVYVGVLKALYLLGIEYHHNRGE